MGNIYLLRIGSIYKLGRSAVWPKRWKTYQAYSPYQLKVVFSLPVPDEYAAEEHLLGLYGHRATPGKNLRIHQKPVSVGARQRVLTTMSAWPLTKRYALDIIELECLRGVNGFGLDSLADGIQTVLIRSIGPW